MFEKDFHNRTLCLFVIHFTVGFRHQRRIQNCTTSSPAINVKLENPSLNRGGGLRQSLSDVYNAALPSVC